MTTLVRVFVQPFLYHCGTKDFGPRCYPTVVTSWWTLIPVKYALRFIYYEVASSCWEKETAYQSMRWLHQLDKNKQHILVRKRWAVTDLEFFPGSNMLVCWVECSLMPLLEQALRIWGSSTFFSLHFCSWFSLDVFTFLHLVVDSPNFIPSLPSIMLAGETSASCAHAQTILGPLVLPIHF